MNKTKGRKRIDIKVNLYSKQHHTINAEIMMEIQTKKLPIIVLLNSFNCIVSIENFVKIEPGEFLSIS